MTEEAQQRLSDTIEALVKTAHANVDYKVWRAIMRDCMTPTIGGIDQQNDSAQ